MKKKWALRFIAEVLLTICDTKECDNTYVRCLSLRKDELISTRLLYGLGWGGVEGGEVKLGPIGRINNTW